MVLQIPIQCKTVTRMQTSIVGCTCCVISPSKQDTGVTQSTRSVNLEVVPVGSAKNAGVLTVDVLTVILGGSIHHLVAGEVVSTGTIASSSIETLGVLSNICCCTTNS